MKKKKKNATIFDQLFNPCNYPFFKSQNTTLERNHRARTRVSTRNYYCVWRINGALLTTCE